MTRDKRRSARYNPRIVSDDLQCLRAENERLTALVASQSALLAAQSVELARQREAMAKLQFYIRGMLRGRFGRSTEKLLDIPATDQQLIAEIEAFIAAERAAAQAVSGCTTPVSGPPEAPVTSPASETADPASAAKPATKRGHRQRPSEAFPNLEVRTSTKDLPEAERLDHAGKPMVKCGEQVSETVVFTQPEVFIDRTVHLRYRSIDEIDADGRLTTAGVPVAERIVDGGMLADVTVHAIAIGKFSDALPANRTLEIMARAGCRLSSSVVDAAIAAFGDLLTPLALEIRNDLRHAPVVGVDAAMMRCRDPELHRKCRRTPIYTVTDGTQAWYHWAPDETHDHGPDVVSGFFTWLITDGWPGWPGAVTIGARLAGCWAHARRPFARIEDDDPDAKIMVGLIHELYEIERRADAAETSLTERARLRDVWSRPIVERIRCFAHDLDRKHPGAGGHPCGKGARYILNQWYTLVKFLDHAVLRLDNNLAEGDLRMVALIRKNSLYLGAASAGPRFAACLSILRSCRLARINPADYLADITPTLITWRRMHRANFPTPDLSRLTPKRWAAEHATAIRRAC